MRLKAFLAGLAIMWAPLSADLPEVKAEAKASIYDAIYQLLPVYTNQVDRYRALYQADATAIAAGDAVLDTLDAAYADYETQIDACTTEQEVYDILGSFTNPPPPGS